VTASVRPTLLNGCASAATAAEARFRIDRPIRGGSARVVGLDAGAAEVVRRIAEQPWGDARFLAVEELTSRLSEELADADVVVMIATCDDGAEAASAIARACAERGITTAGLILGEMLEVGAAVSALRPYARILMVSDDEDDVSEVLTALRA
jgi:cell division GTPase FtsZ